MERLIMTLMLMLAVMTSCTQRKTSDKTNNEPSSWHSQEVPHKDEVSSFWQLIQEIPRMIQNTAVEMHLIEFFITLKLCLVKLTVSHQSIKLNSIIINSFDLFLEPHPED